MDALLLESVPLNKTETDKITDFSYPFWWQPYLKTIGVPRSVLFAALRSDGLFGSGTADDPYNGSTMISSPSSASISWPGVDAGLNASYPSAKKFTVTTSVPHGYANGDLDTISGVTENGQASAYYNGTFIIADVTSDTFTYIIAEPPAAAAGSPSCSRIVFGLDNILRALPANSTLFLGEGVFETIGNGGSDDKGNPPELKDGQRIIGAGIDVTILKLMGGGIAASSSELLGIRLKAMVESPARHGNRRSHY